MTCLGCGAAVVMASPPIEVGGVPLLLEPDPSGGGDFWIYTEVFPDGRPLDGVLRVRARPLGREDTPGWELHECRGGG